ncbi:MAG: hypothetical protein N2560_01770 [Ignavibacteria bacterium]|nr:hypothetical protein [Ignavibacteria bacterium]
MFSLNNPLIIIFWKKINYYKLLITFLLIPLFLAYPQNVDETPEREVKNLNAGKYKEAIEDFNL